MLASSCWQRAAEGLDRHGRRLALEDSSDSVEIGIRMFVLQDLEIEISIIKDLGNDIEQT